MAEENKQDKTYESFKDLEVVDLISKKMAFVKELDKNMKQISGLDLSKPLELMRELDKVIKQLSAVDVTKASERAKLAKSLEKITDLVSNMNVLDQVVAEKTKISKSLEKISEVAASIPVIDKILKEKDF